MHNLWICDWWQDITTSALALSLGLALFTVLLIADTSNLNASQPHQNPPRPRPWTHPPGGCISHSQSCAEEISLDQTNTRKGETDRNIPGITSLLSISHFLLSLNWWTGTLWVRTESSLRVIRALQKLDWARPNYIQCTWVCDTCQCPSNPQYDAADKSMISPPGSFCSWHLSVFLCLPFPL